jgi:hypothetical protein
VSQCVKNLVGGIYFENHGYVSLEMIKTFFTRRVRVTLSPENLLFIFTAPQFLLFSSDFQCKA